METNKKVTIEEYICEICNKTYKNRDGLWKHNNKYHRNIDNLCKPIYNHNVETHNHINNPNIINNNHIVTNNTSNYKCNNCDRSFTCYQNRWRHQKLCQYKSVNENKEEKIDNDKQNKIINLLFEQIKTQKEQLEHFKEQEKQNQEIKKTLMDLINKNCKVHPKTLQKINKQLNGDHNTINENINNGTVNNNNITYNIIGLGHENLTDVFSKKEKMAILKYRYCSLPQLVEYAHFNDKYPQFKNILITNTQNTLAYKYDTKKKQFVAVNKEELLDDIVDERMCDINSFYEELENELDEKTKDILDKVKDKIETDPAYKELKKKDIKLIIYNNRKKVSKEVVDDLEIEV